MNDKERTIMDCVNRAQLAINDWQCSGEIYYLEQARAELIKAIDTADFLSMPACYIADVLWDSDNGCMCDTPEEALDEALEYCDLNAGDTVDVLICKEASWQPRIDVEDLMDNFVDQADDEGGEYSERYIDTLTGEGMAVERENLEDRLNKTLCDWLKQNKIKPDWVVVDGMEGRYFYDGHKFSCVKGKVK